MDLAAPDATAFDKGSKIVTEIWEKHSFGLEIALKFQVNLWLRRIMYLCNICRRLSVEVKECRIHVSFPQEPASNPPSLLVDVTVGRSVGGGALAIVVICRSVSIARVITAIEVAVVAGLPKGLLINRGQRHFTH